MIADSRAHAASAVHDHGTVPHPPPPSMRSRTPRCGNLLTGVRDHVGAGPGAALRAMGQAELAAASNSPLAAPSTKDAHSIRS